MITRIRIRNFRSFRDTTVNLKPFNILVGPNDSGKSNFLDALYVLDRMMWSKLDEVFLGLSHSFNVILFQGSDSKTISFDVDGTATGGLEWKRFKFKYSIEVGPDEKGILHFDRENLKIQSEGSERWLQYINRSGEVTRVLEETRGALKRRSYNFDPDRCAVSSLLDVKRHAYIRAVRLGLGFTHFYKFQPSMMKILAEKKEQKTPVLLAQDGQNLSEALFYLQEDFPDNFRSLKKSLKDAIPNVEDLKLKTIEKWITVTVRQRGDGRSLDFGLASVSDGLLRFLGILSIVYNPIYSASRLLFEELENGIHPHRLETVMNLLRSLASKEDSAQVFVTTHSPYLVDCVTPNDVLVVDKSLGITTIKPISRKRGISELLNEFSLGEAWFSGALGGTP